ncbi:MAG: hypothetical protein IJM30_08490 [Thermoguttaceae bacterium]|nr:hypothetical protein [Thermoguttaceae bacterium]
MIHIGVEPFQNRVSVFSNYIGKITNYEYINGNSVSVIVKTEKSRFALAGKTSFIGNFSCVLGWYKKDEVAPDELARINEAIEKTKVKWDYEKNEWIPAKYGNQTFYIIDHRPVRACLLGNFIAFHYGFNEKSISALLNQSVEWTKDDAREWMKRNKFSTYDHLSQIDYTKGNRDPYIIDLTLLSDPYWQPRRR